MARQDPVLDEEKRSYGALWLVTAVLLFVGALWAVTDDNIVRRPWKKYQAGFNRLEIQRLKDAIAAEQAKLDAAPAYQAAAKAVTDAKTGVASGNLAKRIAELERELRQARQEDQSKDLNLRFVKSELEELRFHYDDALHKHEPTEEIEKTIKDREELRLERQRIYTESQDRIANLENQIKTLQGTVKTAEDAVAKLTTDRDELQQKLENVSLGYLPGPKEQAPYFGFDWQPKIPKIQQIVLPEFDRNNFDEAIPRVDRCMSCHSGINKAGFEDQPNPWKTHPHRDTLLAKHPPERFACTTCHGGQGPAVNSPKTAHGNFYDEGGHLERVEFIEHPLLRAEKMQANCIKCHANVQHVEGADAIARGEYLFEQLGCHGCHLTEGYEELAKQDGVSVIAPSLRRIGAKVDHGWLVRWVKNPHEFRPRTRMPNFLLDEEQATQIAAFLLSTSREASDAWLAQRPPVTVGGAELVAHGRELMDSLGCRACHALAADEVAGQLGSNKDIAPNLSRITEKTNARWIYNWIRNPRDYSPVARMPDLRLSDDEARAVTAYLVTLGAYRPPTPKELDARLADAANVAAGEKLVRKYGCPGCHDIPGMESESRIGVELSAFGSKTIEELFFGDRTDIRETWDDWTYNKLLTPRAYATRWIEQLMPQFDLAEDDIKALSVFLASRTDSKVPVRYVFHPPGQERVLAGHRLVSRYNCTGCHVIEGSGGDIRRLYQDQPTLAPPILSGEGEKVQADWLFNFVKAPVPIRPWLKVRMPTFHLADHEANTVVGYFGALDNVEVPFVHLEKAAFSRDSIEAGKLLTSKEYFDCFSCHQRGAQKPQGPPDGWAPDLALAHQRLNPEWIVKWIRDPQKVMPGTKMPSFYPGGPPDVLGGDDEAQIRALRDYIVSLGFSEAAPSPQQAARVPVGEPGA